jgi:signal transduction histidine kinase/tetratricopeptide (TPR) repeat protein
MNATADTSTIFEKIDKLTDEAWETRVSNSEKSYELSLQAIKLSRENNYSKGLSWALTISVLYLIRQSKFEEAPPILDEAIKIFNSLNDLKGLAVIYEYQALLERNWGNFSGALDLLTKALALSEQTQFTEHLSTNHYQFGVTYKLLGNFEKALEHLYLSRAKSKEINNSLFEAYAINIIGSIYFETGDYEQALDYLLQGLGPRQEAGDKWGIAGSLNYIGITYFKLKDYARAEEYCKKSLAITDETGDKRGHANTYFHLAEIYRSRGELKKAEKYCHESLDIRVAIGDKRGQAEILLFLSELLPAEEEPKFLDKALEIAEQINAKDLVSKTRLNLYEFYKKRGDFKDAVAQLEQHITLEKELHNSVVTQKVQNLEITHKAEEAISEAQAVRLRNEELLRFNKEIETKNRELEIEAALDRVRTKVMGMKNSSELNETSLVFGDQLKRLGIEWQFSYFWLVNEDKNENTFWITWPDYKTSITSYTMNEAEEYFNDCLVSWRTGIKIHDNYVPPNEVKAWLDTYQRIADNAGGEAKKIMVPETFEKGVYYYDAMMKYGSFGICINKPATKEEKDIQCRFAIEFERAYTRFLELKKAEEQSREAQIEAALERVRSKSMAMHHSNDLLSIIEVVREQLTLLGFKFDAVNFITDITEQDYLFWLAVPGEKIVSSFRVPRHDYTGSRLLQEAIEQGKLFYSYTLDKSKKDLFFRNFFENSEARNLSEEGKQHVYSMPGLAAAVVVLKKVVFNVSNFEGVLYSDEENNIIIRFGQVFEQSYTRFLDLQKVEARARESKIEASLDRVRAMAMAMHSSKDLAETVNTFFKELKILGIIPIRCGVGVIDDKTQTSSLTATTSSKQGDSYAVVAELKLQGHPVLESIFIHWQQQEEYYPVLTGKELKNYYQAMRPQAVFPDYPEEAIQYGNYFYFPEGLVFAWTEKALTDEEVNIFRRFTSVISLTYRRYKELVQAELLAAKAEEDLVLLKEEKRKTEEALKELKATQAQLIQSEKMASLGELTAGIAHEIQNPLNFVNNFSEVNSELIDELKTELEAGNRQQAFDIARDIKENEIKIIHHGKRADAIVKGMLQHSRSSSGQKEPTDINILADEYLRLAYHGLRAKDKSFNAKFETDFDPSLGKINVLPQDLGRVILNLINNAFYAVSAKASSTTEKNYTPTVLVSTRKTNGNVELKIRDNGIGIPEKAIDKIFQPFFTTKPTGQGTGLGLSLSYDIIRSHGGNINVKTKEEEGTEFIISIPANSR